MSCPCFQVGSFRLATDTTGFRAFSTSFSGAAEDAGDFRAFAASSSLAALDLRFLEKILAPRKYLFLCLCARNNRFDIGKSVREVREEDMRDPFLLAVFVKVIFGSGLDLDEENVGMLCSGHILIKDSVPEDCRRK